MNDKLTDSIKNHGIEEKLRNTICIDIDGVIVNFYSCDNCCDYTDYPNCYDVLKRMECPLIERVKESFLEIKAMGLNIVLETGRVEEERYITEKFLKKHGISYDELIMGRTRALMYINDFGYQFDNWEQTMKEVKLRYNMRYKK